jgi:hypothetical protein
MSSGVKKGIIGWLRLILAIFKPVLDVEPALGRVKPRSYLHLHLHLHLHTALSLLLHMGISMCWMVPVLNAIIQSPVNIDHQIICILDLGLNQLMICQS